MEKWRFHGLKNSQSAFFSPENLHFVNRPLCLEMAQQGCGLHIVSCAARDGQLPTSGRKCGKSAAVVNNRYLFAQLTQVKARW